MRASPLQDYWKPYCEELHNAVVFQLRTEWSKGHNCKFVANSSYANKLRQRKYAHCTPVVPCKFVAIEIKLEGKKKAI